jgi:hypothetical protein
MTGIGRKEVGRLRRHRTGYEDSVRVELSPLSDVLHHWFTEPDYLRPDGKPKVLRMQGGRISFEGLVRSCIGDIPAGAIKVELVRCGSVMEDSKGRLFALRRQVIPAGLDEKLITAMVFSLRGLASTIAFNTSVNDLGAAGRIERFCLSDNLTEEAIASMHPVFRKHVRNFAESSDDLLAQAEKSAPGSGRRIGVGVFYYEDD